jgi:hypothetical protein
MLYPSMYFHCLLYFSLSAAQLTYSLVISIRLRFFKVYAVLGQRIPFAVYILFSCLFFAESNFGVEMRYRVVLAFCEAILKILCHNLILLF